VLQIQSKPKPLPDRRQQQNDLHHREVVPDTLPWSSAEREVSILWYLLPIFPTLRFEFIRLIEVTRIAMRYPLKRNGGASIVLCKANVELRRRAETLTFEEWGKIVQAIR